MRGSKQESGCWSSDSGGPSLENGARREYSTCTNWKPFASLRANGPGSYDPEKIAMQDLIFVATTIAFFIVSIAYVYFCERVK